MTVFNTLRAIQSRPSMYLGGDDQHRLEQLRALQAILHGYSLALIEHRIEEPGLYFVRGFTEHVAAKGWKVGPLGAIAAIRDASAGPDEAWDTFWRLIWDYAASFPAADDPEVRG